MPKFKYNTDITMVQTQYQGWLYEGEGSYFDAFSILNRKEAIKKNAKGQVYAADMFCQERYHNSVWATAGRTAFHYYIGQQYYEMVKKSSIDVCAAILAIPASYGNLPETAANRRDQSTAWRAETWHENNVYYYLLVLKGDGQDVIKVSFPNHDPRYPSQPNRGYYLWRAECMFDQITSSSTSEQLVVNKPAGNDRYYSTTTIDSNESFERKISELTHRRSMQSKYDELKNADTGPASRRAFAYNPSYGFIDEGIFATWQTGISHWEERPNNSLENIWVVNLPASHMPSYITSQKLSSVLSSGFPVFELHNFDQMVEYFEGGKWEADNYPIPDDWSTDWDVYVKGAQKPDIFITMKSDKVDEWLASDKNLSGYTKEDIKVQYRYSEYGNPTSAQPEPVGILYPSRGTKKMWLDTKYGEVQATDYVSNLALNYPLSDMILFPTEFRGLTPSVHYGYYAQLDFRLYLSEEYRSSWCQYRIGIIGSPSVADFSKMHNLGLSIDLENLDASTVTLHYDEYPDGFDPYPEPEPPTPNPPKPTDPIPSVTGIGLLTETYKITEQQAKALGRFFWGGDTFQKILALNLSPIENVVGLHYMPINVAGTTDVIVIGDVNTNINGDRIETTTPLYTLGSVKIEGRYKNFLDYEPYTSAWIFLPFVGFIRINPVFFTGKTLKVVYTYDLICGLCMAMLYADDIYIESHQGKCGLEIPLVAGNRAQLETALAMSLVTQGLTAAATGGLGTIASVAGIAGSIGSYVENFHSTREGGYTPACAWAETRECFIVIESSNASYTASYNHDFGRPCMATYTIGQLKGFTMIDPNTELSGFDGITDEEITRLRQILTTGFYV